MLRERRGGKGRGGEGRGGEGRGGEGRGGEEGSKEKDTKISFALLNLAHFAIASGSFPTYNFSTSILLSLLSSPSFVPPPLSTSLYLFCFLMSFQKDEPSPLAPPERREGHHSRMDC